MIFYVDGFFFENKTSFIHQKFIVVIDRFLIRFTEITAGILLGEYLNLLRCLNYLDFGDILMNERKTIEDVTETIFKEKCYRSYIFL